VGVVVHREVSQPCASVGIHADFIAPFEVEQDGGSSHGILVVVLVVLVEHGGYFFSIEADGEQGFLVVVSGDVEDKQVAATHRSVEDTSIGIHATANVDASALN